MEMKFKLDAAALNAALEVVSIVPPRPVTPQGGAGYLFVIRKDREGKDHCYIYSRDMIHVARADFAVRDVEGEGAFIFPSAHVESFKFAEGEIAFTVTSDGDNHSVTYSFGGAEATVASFDPRLMAPCDKELESSTTEKDFEVAVLREAINMARPFLAKVNDQRVEEHYKTFQVFDGSIEALAKADGYLFASTGVQAFYFYCEAFKGKGLSVHGQHLPFVTQFLAKADGFLKVKTGPNMTFAIDSRGCVLGWAHHTKTYQKFSYYTLKTDKMVMAVPKGAALNALRYTKTMVDPKRDKIRMTYEQATGQLQFQVIEGNAKAKSFPVPATLKEGSEPRDFTFNVNIDHIIELFNDSKAGDVELRVAIIPVGEGRPKEQLMLRTIDEFWLDRQGKVVAGSGVEEGKEPEGAFRCRVTRFMPGKD